MIRKLFLALLFVAGCGPTVQDVNACGAACAAGRTTVKSVTYQKCECQPVVEPKDCAK